MKVRVDVEVYERWIAVFYSFQSTRGYHRIKSIYEKSKEALYDRIRHCFKQLTDMYLAKIIWEKRVKFKVKNKKYDLLIESKEYIHDLSADPIFKEDDERIGELWRQNPNIFYI